MLKRTVLDSTSRLGRDNAFITSYFLQVVCFVSCMASWDVWLPSKVIHIKSLQFRHDKVINHRSIALSIVLTSTYGWLHFRRNMDQRFSLLIELKEHTKPGLKNGCWIIITSNVTILFINVPFQPKVCYSAEQNFLVSRWPPHRTCFALDSSSASVSA